MVIFTTYNALTTLEPLFSPCCYLFTFFNSRLPLINSEPFAALLFFSHDLRLWPSTLTFEPDEDAVGDCRLPCRCCYVANSTKQRCLSSNWCRHLVKWTKHRRCLWFWPTRSIVGKYDVIRKQEVSNILHCRQTWIKQRPQVIMCIIVQRIWWNSDGVFWDMRVDRQRDRQTYRQT